MIHHIYCDESRQTKDRFMAFGGIIIEQVDIEEVNKTIQLYRAGEQMFAELKWNKVSKAKLPQYKRLIDYFFALNNADKIHFHSLIVDNHAVNHKKYNEGDKELGFYKFYYQLVLNCFGRWYSGQNQENRFLVYLDQRTSSYSLNDFKRILNNGMRKKFNHSGYPFRTIEPRNSKKVDLLQLTDVVLGAIGFHKNGYELLSESSEAKSELAEYIAQKAGVAHLGNSTSYSRTRFKIWNIQLKK